jgi:site-specific recombinase XerD
VAARYLDGYAKTRLKPKSFIGVARYLNQHWAPLEEMPVHRIGRADVAARLADISKGNGPFAANRARAALSALYSWAIGEGLVDQNPLSALARLPTKSRAIASFPRKSFARFGSLPVMANMARLFDC